MIGWAIAAGAFAASLAMFGWHEVTNNTVGCNETILSRTCGVIVTALVMTIAWPALVWAEIVYYAKVAIDPTYRVPRWGEVTPSPRKARLDAIARACLGCAVLGFTFGLLLWLAGAL